MCAAFLSELAALGGHRGANVIKLRLRRMGAKKRPSYRIVAADSRSPRDGRIIESIGFYDPLTEPSTLRLETERVQHWLSVGAAERDCSQSASPAGIGPR